MDAEFRKAISEGDSSSVLVYRDWLLDQRRDAEAHAIEAELAKPPVKCFDDLLGRVAARVDKVSDKTGDELRFALLNGQVAVLYHEPDCCESVIIEDIEGDLETLAWAPLLQVAEESNPSDVQGKEGDDSFTWTFYKFATVKGYVTVRWYGSSNGYYSERVDFKVC